MSRKRSAFFSWRQAVLKSSLPMPTKCLLLVLSCHMNDAGEECFPSIGTLMAEASMGRTAVIKHLKIAVAAGWIEIGKHGFGDRRWARNEYRMRWPDDLEGGSPDEPPQTTGGGSPSELPQARGGSPGEPPPRNEAVHVATRGGSRRDTEAVRQVNSSTPVNSSLPLQVPGLNTKAWYEWEDYRRKIRKPLKPESIPAAQRKLAAIGSEAKQAEAVEHSIANGYIGLFAPRSGSGRKTFDDYDREMTRQIAEARKREHANRAATDDALPGEFDRLD